MCDCPAGEQDGNEGRGMMAEELRTESPTAGAGPDGAEMRSDSTEPEPNSAEMGPDSTGAGPDRTGMELKNNAWERLDNTGTERSRS